jgi:prepilin-type N-terminal cleavage/methylation domain-containing protein
MKTIAAEVQKVAVNTIRGRRGRAFTLVEIMVVVVIIGLLAALAVAGFTRLKVRTENNAISNDLRVFASAFETYALQNGGWPSSSPGPGQLPPEMVGAIKPEAFARAPLAGCSYVWGTNEGESAIETFAALAIGASDEEGDLGSVLTLERVLSLDEQIDDGNFSSGRIRVINNRIVFFLTKPLSAADVGITTTDV